MERNRPARDRVGQIDRRTLLKLTGGAAVSTVAASGAVTAKGRGNGNGENGGGKQGGRGHTSSDVYLREPFTVEKKKEIWTNASCMSDQSAEQKYVRYFIHYCDEDLDEEGQTFCVIPDESELNEERVYEFRSKQECKADSREFQEKVSFGPSNSDC